MFSVRVPEAANALAAGRRRLAWSNSQGQWEITLNAVEGSAILALSENGDFPTFGVDTTALSGGHLAVREVAAGTAQAAAMPATPASIAASMAAAAAESASIAAAAVVEPTVVPVTHVCGNGARSSGLECDDGNTDAYDGCSDSCLVESGWMCTDTLGATTVSLNYKRA